MVLGSGIRDPGSGKNLFQIPDPRSRGQKGTGSRIWIRNTGFCVRSVSGLDFRFPVRKGANVCATGLFPAWISGFLSGIILSSLLIVWLLLRLYPPVSYSRQSPHAFCIVLLWIRIHPDLHPYLGMRIQIQEHGKWPKFTNKPGFLPFKKAFVPSYVCFLTYYLLSIPVYFEYFHVKIQLFVT